MRSAGAWKSVRPAEPAVAEASTVGAAVAHGRAALKAAGCATPRLDAELLLAAALGVGRERLVIDRDERLDPPAAERFEALLARRITHEPVAYILGRRAFRYLTLTVDRRVLIPRPETELLVEVGLELAPGCAVVDVGTGSGAVALALKHERPDLVVRGTDVSADALAVARGNAARLGLEVEFAQADLLHGAPCDAVLANLPYVPDAAVLEPEIGFEPSSALFAGADGLALVRRLIAAVAAVAVSAPGAPVLLALEIGPEQAAEVSRLMRSAGFSSVEVRRDLAGLDRVVIGSS